MSDGVPPAIIREMVSQTGAVLVAIFGVASAIAGAVGAWFHGRRAGEKRTPINGGEARLHDHLTQGFKAQLQETRRHYESLLAEYRELHEQRSRRIEELTNELGKVMDEVHELREEVRHLHHVLASHGIEAPPRQKAR